MTSIIGLPQRFLKRYVGCVLASRNALLPLKIMRYDFRLTHPTILQYLHKVGVLMW